MFYVYKGIMSSAILHSVTVQSIQKFKNLPKIGVKKFCIFLLKIFHGSGTSMKYQVQPYVLHLYSLEAHSPRTNRQTDGRRVQFPGARYLITNPFGMIIFFRCLFISCAAHSPSCCTIQLGYIICNARQLLQCWLNL